MKPNSLISTKQNSFNARAAYDSHVAPMRPSFQPVFKIEVVNALQMQFGPSKCNPKLEMKSSIQFVHHKNQQVQGHCHYKKWS